MNSPSWTPPPGNVQGRTERSFHAPRAGLLHRLGQFLASAETVFLLTGPSGSGKSSALAHWSIIGLRGLVRLLLAGSRSYPGVGRYGDSLQIALVPTRIESGAIKSSSTSSPASPWSQVRALHPNRSWTSRRPRWTRCRVRSSSGNWLTPSEGSVESSSAARRRRGEYTAHGFAFPEGTLFDPDRTLGQPSTNRSYELGVLSPDQLLSVVERRFPYLACFTKPVRRLGFSLAGATFRCETLTSSPVILSFRTVTVCFRGARSRGRWISSVSSWRLSAGGSKRPPRY